MKAEFVKLIIISWIFLGHCQTREYNEENISKITFPSEITHIDFVRKFGSKTSKEELILKLDNEFYRFFLKSLKSVYFPMNHFDAPCGVDIYRFYLKVYTNYSESPMIIEVKRNLCGDMYEFPLEKQVPVYLDKINIGGVEFKIEMDYSFSDSLTIIFWDHYKNEVIIK